MMHPGESRRSAPGNPASEPSTCGQLSPWEKRWLDPQTTRTGRNPACGEYRRCGQSRARASIPANTDRQTKHWPAKMQSLHPIWGDLAQHGRGRHLQGLPPLHRARTDAPPQKEYRRHRVLAHEPPDDRTRQMPANRRYRGLRRTARRVFPATQHGAATG